MVRKGKVSLWSGVLGIVLAIASTSLLAAEEARTNGTVTSESAVPTQRWITTWTTSNQSGEKPPSFSNQTIREIVHTTIGGSAVRLRLANTFGTRAVVLDAVYVGLQKEGAALVANSAQEVRFGGSPSISIPEGAEVLSDPVELMIGSEQNVTISLFSRGETGPATMHNSSFQTNYVSGRGNFASGESADGFKKTNESWYFLAAVEVLATAETRGAVVALGDSITDGAAARSDRNERWTDVLGRRLLANHIDMAVLNAGISGNRVLTSSPCFGQNALARLGRDVLAQSGIESVILFEGTNDIGQPDTRTLENNPCLTRIQVSADEIVAGYQQIIARTHARGLKIFGATILPYQGYGAWTERGEAKRIAVNKWIRTSGAFDGVVDFDAALRDAANPARMATQFDSGDHLHPGPAGQEAMGNAVDLALFRRAN